MGRFISTKAAGKGNFAREDITALYKYSEGTPEEAKSFEKAFQYTGNRPNRSFMTKHLLEEPDKKFAISELFFNFLNIQVDSLTTSVHFCVLEHF